MSRGLYRHVMRKVLFALMAFFVTAEPAWTQEKKD